MAWKIMQGDVRAMLSGIPEKSVHCVVTSPPYWGLRDYGLPPSVWGGEPECEHEWEKFIRPGQSGGKKSKKVQIKGQENFQIVPDKEQSICRKCGAWFGCLGLEPTPELYVKHMVEIFRGVWRVLRDDGTLWLNLGDSYASGGMSNPSSNSTLVGGKDLGAADYSITRKVPNGLKPKDLVGIPWRVAFALQADGWYLRSAMPWLKGSAMPESVTDRPTSAVEYFFLLTKNRKYFYDVDSVRKLASDASLKRINQKSFDKQKGGEKDYKHGINVNRSSRNTLENFAKNPGRNRRNSDWFMDSIRDILEGKSGTLLHDENDIPIAIFCNPQPYKEAHFATFSPRLITPMILAGTSPRACEICGSPWERVVEREPMEIKRSGRGVALGKYGKTAASGTMTKPATSVTTGWRPTCTCENEGKGRCIVLDPFAGSGTTLWVAEQHGRNSIGIELNPDYCKLIHKRMDKMQMNVFSLGVS
jgi:DNA modification methylase